jgi:tellurite resistance protein TehA-like permease
LDLVYPLLVAPVAILLAAVSLAVSGLSALILGSLLALVLAKTTAWTIAIIVGVVLLVLAVVVPLTLLGGLREVFKSSAWTLTFSEAVRNQSTKRSSSPQPALQHAGAD